MKPGKAKPLTAEELISKYADIVYRIAFSRLGNAPDAEDITQEVFIKYIKADMTFVDEDHRRKWLIRVTVNAVNSLAASAWRKRTAPLEEAEDISVEEDSGEAMDIRQAMEKLPEKYRTPIHLFYYEDMTIHQIAQAMDSSEGTIKSLLSRGRSKLRELLGEDLYD